MEKKLSQRIKEQLASLRSHKRWQAFAGVLSLLVLCWTVYALILPAVATTEGYTSLDNTKPEISCTKPDTKVAGTVYDTTTGNYKSDLKLTWTLNKNDTVNAGYKYSYTYPENIIVPDSLLDKSFKLLDNSNQEVGKYRFEKNEDGTYTLYMELDEETVDAMESNYTVYVSFSGSIGADAVRDNGEIVVNFHDQVTLTIDPSQIEYTDGETRQYDMSVSKDGSYTADGKLVYTVTVLSYKGTPNALNLEDVLTASNTTVAQMIKNLDGVTVTQGTVKKYAWTDSWSDGTETLLTLASDASSLSKNMYYYDASSGALYACLDKLAGGSNDGETQTDSNGEYREASYYKITYTFDLNDLAIGEVYVADNTVAVKATDQKTQETVQGSASKKVTIDKDYKISKTGAAGSEAGKIKWTITVNSGGQDIAGTVLADTMLGSLDSKAITITSNNGSTGGYAIQTDAAGKVTKIDFSAADGTGAGTNTNTYTITYETDIPTEATDWDGGTVSNTATWTNGSGDTIGSATGTYTVSGGGVAKEATDAGSYDANAKTATIAWKSTITLPLDGLAAGTVITDNMLRGGKENWNTGSYQYMTADQIKNIKIVCIDADDTETVLDTDKYTLNLYTGTDGNQTQSATYDPSGSGALAEAQYTEYEVVLKGALSYDAVQKLVLTYTTTADFTDASTAEGAQNTYKNMVAVLEKTAGNSYTFTNGKVVKTDGNNVSGDSTTASEDGTLAWKVKTTTDNLQSYSWLRVTDTLPNDLSLTSLSYYDTVSREETTLTIATTVSSDGTYAVSGTCGDYTISGTYNAETQVVTLTIKRTDGTAVAQDKEFTITYNCKVSGGVLAAGTATYTNTAKVTTEKGSYGSDEQKQTWQKTDTTGQSKDLLKSGTFDNNARRMEYQLVINPEGADLLAGSNTLQLEDTLTYWKNANEANRNYELVQSSVKLYHAVKGDDGTYTKGEQITDWTWTFSEVDAEYPTKTIKATIPDGQALILEYAYTVDVTWPTGWDDVELGVSNTAKIYGTSIETKEDDSKDKWKKSETSGAVSGDKVYTVYKVESGSYGTALAGAEFTVQEYDTDKKEFVATGKTYTTGKNGAFSVAKDDTDDSDNKVYEVDTLYRLVETKAPEGYKLNESASYCYFYFDSDASYTLPTIDGTTTYTATNLSKSTKTEYIENEKKPENQTTTISVIKQWFDENGGQMQGDGEGLPSSITFTLYQDGYSVGTDGTQTTLEQKTVGTYTATKINNWEWSSANVAELASGLPTVVVDDDETATYYTYSIKETKVSGYTASYSDADTSASGVTAFTIKNTKENRTETPAKITVNKEWFDTDGTTLTPDADQTITFDLYQVETEKSDSTETGATTLKWCNAYGSPLDSEELLLTAYPVGATVEATFQLTGYADSYRYGDVTATSQIGDETAQKLSVSKSVSGETATYTVQFVVKENMTVTVNMGSEMYNTNNWSYQGSKVVSSANTNATLVKTEKLSNDNNWSCTFTDLPKSATVTTSAGTTAYEYTYYVKERSVDGYSTTYQYGDSDTEYTDTVNGSLSEGTVTIENTKKKGLTIEKVWQNAEGTDVKPSVAEIGYTVYQIATVKPKTVTVTLQTCYGASAQIGVEKVSPGEGYVLKVHKVDSSAQWWTSATELINSTTNATIQGSLTVDENNGGMTFTYELGSITEDTVYKLNRWETDVSPYSIVSLTSTTENTGTTSSTEKKYLTGKLTAADDWKALITDDQLPTEGTVDGVTYEYTYRVEETDGSKYNVKYSLDGTNSTTKPVTVSGGYVGTLTITNTVDESEVYTLPNTGGRGTILYIVGGTALASAALLALAYRNKKKQRGGRMAH